MMTFKFLAGLTISAYFLIAILLFVFQRDLIYFPSATYAHTLTIEPFLNEGERVEVVVLNESNENAILYFGGNAESVVHSSVSLANAFPAHTLYLVNYRGYGGSSGNPTEQALYSDAQYIYDIVEKRHADVSVIGRSLGSGIATFLASTRAIRQMVLVTPYDSIQRIAQDRFPIYPMTILLKDKYDSVDRIKEIESRTLVILAEHDKVIPLKYSVRLIEAFPEQQITVKTILGAGHNNLSDGDEYYVLLQNFME
ncbi:MAG: alpha/beta hydrolase [Motiliproteus sp.]